MSHKEYEAGDERLLNMGSQAVNAFVTAGANQWLSQPVATTVEIKTAAQDVETAKKGLELGQSRQGILDTIRNSEVYQRVAKQGGDAEQYAELIVRRGETVQAMEAMPEQGQEISKKPKRQL